MLQASTKTNENGSPVVEGRGARAPNVRVTVKNREKKIHKISKQRTIKTKSNHHPGFDVKSKPKSMHEPSLEPNDNKVPTMIAPN